MCIRLGSNPLTYKQHLGTSGLDFGTIVIFIIYLSNLHNTFHLPHDTCLFFSSNKLSSLETNMNLDLDKICVCAIVNTVG